MRYQHTLWKILGNVWLCVFGEFLGDSVSLYGLLWGIIVFVGLGQP